MTGRPLLALVGVSKIYGSGQGGLKALDEVSLDVHEGEFVAIVGQSGSGKSTLMQIIGCLDRPTSGSYHISGREVAGLDADALAALRRDTFGFVFQRYNLLATATAAENVEIPAIYAGRPHAERLARAHELLARLGLGDRAGHRPSQLSGGQQQRVSIARALMNDAPVILADEPTGALDSQSGLEVMDLLAKLNAEGRTVLLITHNPELAQRAGRVVRMRDGRIVDDAPTAASARPRIADSVQPRQAHGASLVPDLAEAVKMALRSLRANLFRTALTLLGVVIGVAAVVTMLAVGDGSKADVLARIQAMGTNLLMVIPGAPGMRPTGDIATMVPGDATAIAEVANVEAVAPERGMAVTVRAGNIDYQTQVQGVWPGFPKVRDWTTERGSFIAESDVLSYAPVAVIGRTVAENLFPNVENPLGQYILISNIPFEIIGVMAAKGASAMGDDQDDVLFVPLSTGFMRLFGKQQYPERHHGARGRREPGRCHPGGHSRAAPLPPPQRGFPDPQHLLAAGSRDRDPEHPDHPARLRGRHLAPGRRHRGHEHHARQRHRTHPRDRHPHGHRRAHAEHPPAVQHRSPGRLRHRRHHRRGPRARGRGRHRNLRRQGRLLALAAASGLFLRLRHRPGLRLPAGAQSREA